MDATADEAVWGPYLGLVKGLGPTLPSDKAGLVIWVEGRREMRIVMIHEEEVPVVLWRVGKRVMPLRISEQLLKKWDKFRVVNEIVIRLPPQHAAVGARPRAVSPALLLRPNHASVCPPMSQAVAIPALRKLLVVDSVERVEVFLADGIPHNEPPLLPELRPLLVVHLATSFLAVCAHRWIPGAQQVASIAVQ